MAINRTPALMSAARAAVAHALTNGTLRRATFCAQCGSDDTILDGHHQDYAQPLLVEWLCRPCHRARHRETPINSRVRPRCVKCSRLIYLWLMDLGKYSRVSGEFAHKGLCPKFREQRRQAALRRKAALQDRNVA